MPDTFHFTEDSYGQSIISLFKETGYEYHYGPEIEAVILFGSRAKGCYKKGSDIDLAIKGAGITHSTVLLLKSELEDSMLPFFVDVLHYESVSSPTLREHIDRVGIRL